MKVISIVQQKGGVGKTTIAVHLSGAFVQMGAQVTLFDADAQQSALAWAEPKKLPFAVQAAPFSPEFPIAWVKPVVDQGGDIAVIDTSPGLGALLTASVEFSDLLVLPCGPSSVELVALRKAVETIAELKRRLARPVPKLLIVPTRVDPTTQEGQALREELLGFGAAIGPTLPFDMEYVRAFTSGETVATSAPDSPADRSMKALGEEIVRSLWNEAGS